MGKKKFANQKLNQKLRKKRQKDSRIAPSRSKSRPLFHLAILHTAENKIKKKSGKKKNTAIQKMITRGRSKEKQEEIYEEKRKYVE